MKIDDMAGLVVKALTETYELNPEELNDLLISIEKCYKEKLIEKFNEKFKMLAGECDNKKEEDPEEYQSLQDKKLIQETRKLEIANDRELGRLISKEEVVKMMTSIVNAHNVYNEIAKCLKDL